MIGVVRSRVRSLSRTRKTVSLWLTALAGLGVMALPAAAQADAQWTGASSSSQWSNPDNWAGTPPAANNPAGTLAFPTLGSCGTCYTSNNDLTGVSATGLVLGNASGQYDIKGNAFSVGTSGITDGPGGNSGDIIHAPVVLTGASQAWVVGSSSGYNNLTFLGGVTSSAGTDVTVSTPHGSELFIDSDMEVGPVTFNGPGILHIGAAPGAGHPGSINGSSGQPLTIQAGELIPNPSSTSGPLTMGAGTILLLGTFKTNTHATTLHVNGTAQLASSTTMQTFINGNGTTAGTDFSQLSASGNVTIGGHLTIGHGPNSSGSCITLNPGAVATLITTNGTLSGTFSGVPDGAVLNLAAPCTGTASQVRINYTSNSVVATVLGPPTPTTTTLAAPNPAPASTNQQVTLTARVATTSMTPSGTVAFSANGSAIPGCNAQPVAGSGSSATATCTTSFAALGSPESLTATFNAANASVQAGSTSSARMLTVNPAATSTTLAASDTNPVAGGSVTYTATVTPATAGPDQPGGTVAFQDGGSPISSCSAQTLKAGASSSTATCKVTYASAGSHSISAGYGGDRNFNGSSSGVTAVAVSGAGTPGTAQEGRTSSVAVVTSRATRIGTSQATLNGGVSGGRGALTWWFEYGRTRAFGHATVRHKLGVRAQTSSRVSLTLKSLSPNVRYYFRLVVRAAVRTFDGKDLAFTTKARGMLTGPKGTLTLVRRTIPLVERCQSTMLCRGRITLTRTTHTGSRARLQRLRCARAAIRINAGRSATVYPTMSAPCLRLLQAEPNHRMPVVLTISTQTGQRGERERIMLVLQPAGAPAPSRSG